MCARQPPVRRSVGHGGADRGRRPDKKQEIHIPAAFSKLFKTPLRLELRTPRRRSTLADREMYLAARQGHRWLLVDQRDDVGTRTSGRLRRLGPARLVLRRRAALLPPDRAPDRHQLGGTYGTDGPLWIEELRDPNPLTEAFLTACGEAGLKRLPSSTSRTTPDSRRPRSPCTGAGAGVRPTPTCTRSRASQPHRDHRARWSSASSRHRRSDGRATGVAYRDRPAAPARSTRAAR